MINNFKFKYLKYKSKYLELKGSGIKSSNKYFYDKIKSNYNKIYNILKEDIYLIKTINNIGLPTIDSINKMTLEEIKTLNIFQEILRLISLKYDEKNIDLFIKFYLNNSINSIEDNERFYTNIYRLNILIAYNIKNNIDYKKKDDFNLFDELENYINDNQFIIDNIIEENDRITKNKNNRNSEEKRIKEEGEKFVDVELKTDKIIIYVPTTMEGSIYYGRNTKWCTASKNKENNMFNSYNEHGKIYIIQTLNNKNFSDKYQMQFETGSLMNSEDKPVELNFIKNNFNDNTLNEWLDKKCYEYILIKKENIKDKLNINNNILNINSIDNIINLYEINKNELNKIEKLVLNIKIPFYFDYYNPILRLNNLEEFIMNSFDEFLFDNLFKFKNLKELYYDYNKLGDSLNKLINLKKLSFGSEFNIHLGNSISSLINLEQINFGPKFDQSLDNSLFNLKKLKKLEFSDDKIYVNTYFNNGGKPLNDSLSNLNNLEELIFSKSFDQALDNSLYGLTKLKKLVFGTNFLNNNKPLKDSLSKLENLEELIFCNYFNNNSIDPLNDIFNPLNNSLFKLTKLKKLKITISNKNFINKNSLPTSLEELIINCDRGFIINDIFLNLINLKKLIFNGSFENGNKPLNDSLFSLVNLEELYFNDGLNYGFNNGNEPLKDSLSTLRKLKILKFSDSFNNGNEPLKDSLSNLFNLEELIFCNEFNNGNRELEDSLCNLINLKKLT
jgi:hypothetical protein